MEPIFISGPLVNLLYTLCEDSRERVLGQSVKAVSFDDALDEVIKAAWLLDFDSKNGLSAVTKASKSLPTSAIFLRALLASHFIARVYWTHWSSEHRIALLEAVEAVLPEGKHLTQKGRIKRLIEAAEKKDGNRGGL